jgi:hypothetical protein
MAKRSLSSSRAPHARVPGAVPPGVREPMPGVLEPLLYMTAQAIFVVLNVASVIVLGNLFSLAFALAGAAFIMHARSMYIGRKEERDLLRWKNYEAVEDWIINAELPAASDALVKREHEDARAYRELRAKKGKRPDGSQAPDPNSNRSKKRAARRERAKQRRHERELEEQIVSAMNVPPMILGEPPDPNSNAFTLDERLRDSMDTQRAKRLIQLMEESRPLDTRWYP